MEGLISLEDIKELPYIVVKDGVVAETSESFSNITEYKMSDLINKSVEKVFSILKLAPYTDMGAINEKTDYFLFTKSLEVRFINIEIIKKRDEQVYIIREKPNSRFEDKFKFLHQLCLEDMFGVAVYSIPDLTLLKANQSYFDFLNTPYNTPAQALGKSALEIAGEWENERSSAMWDGIVANAKSKGIRELEFDTPSRGKTYWDVTFIPISEDGRVKYIVISSLEVTERVLYRKQLEEKTNIIKQQKEKLELFVENMVDALLLVDKDYKFIMLNKAAEDVFYMPDNINKHGDSLAHTKYYDLEGKQLSSSDLPGRRILRGEKIKQLSLKAERPDKTIYLGINGKPIYNEEGGVDYAALCIHDISEKVKYQQEIQAQKEMLEKAMEMKDEFLSIISHELRTPLNVISTAIQAIDYFCKDDLPDKAKEYIGMIRQNSNRQIRLVNNLLDITRANSGRISINKRNIDIVFLTKAITESVYTYASQKGVKLTFNTSLEDKIIATDDEKYERILLNLLSNAIKFTPAGKCVEVRMNGDESRVCIEVEDNGIGIAQEHLNMIFERFGQVNSSLSRQAEGAGIGLSIVKKFVEALGGNISVSSIVDKGTTFILTLPCEIIEETEEKTKLDFMDNRLVESCSIEFSDIYL